MRASLIGLVEVFGENRIVLIVSSEGVLEKWAFFAHQSRDCVRKSEDRICRSAVFSMECGSSKKKLPVTLSACGQFAAAAARILVGNTLLANNKGETIVVALAGETNRALRRCSVAERFDLNLAAEIRNRERYPAVGDDFHAGRFRCVNDNSLLCEYCFFGKISFHEEPILGHSSSLCGTHSNVFFTAFPSKKHFRRIGLGDVVRKIFISFVARNHCNARYKRHGREQKLVHLLHIVRIVLYV